jgi:hypothetical protein
MIIDRKKIYRALRAFDININTKNELLEIDQRKLEIHMNKKISKTQDKNLHFILEIYKSMIICFINYYKLKNEYIKIQKTKNKKVVKKI